jgi:glycosyltransferase involved in cell wall biosynthesis
MKIAFLTPEFPHPQTGTSGGLGTSVKNLADGLVRAGHEPLILVYGQDSDAFFEDNGLSVYQIKNVKIKGLSWYLTRRKIERLINALYIQGKLDVVEAPDWTGISSFIRPKCQLTVRLHGSDTYFCHLDNRPVKWFNRFHEKRALSRADALLSVSRFTADVTNELFALDREFTVIPNGVDTAAFTPSVETEKHSILYFGTLIRKKGLLELPHIFNIVNRVDANAELVLVGRDAADIVSGNKSTWEMMQPLFSDSARTKVTYAGSVPYTQIQEYIREAAVCIFPTFAEALPVSWIEAMAMGKAVVASNIGWAEEVIEDGKSGMLVYPANHTLYAEKITALLNDKTLREKVGIQARKRIANFFDADLIVAKNIAFYQNLLTQNK